MRDELDFDKIAKMTYLDGFESSNEDSVINKVVLCNSVMSYGKNEDFIIYPMDTNSTRPKYQKGDIHYRIFPEEDYHCIARKHHEGKYYRIDKEEFAEEIQKVAKRLNVNDRTLLKVLNILVLS